MSATDARPVPIRGVAYRHYFLLRDSDGAPLTGWAGQDSEISKDGAAFVACTNEAVEIGSGWGYLELTAAEMAADAVLLNVTVTGASPGTAAWSIIPDDGDSDDARAAAARW